MEDADWIDGCMVKPSLRPAKRPHEMGACIVHRHEIMPSPLSV